MKSKLFILMLFMMTLAFGLLAVTAQEPDDDDVRGAFLSSRPKTTNTNAPSGRHRPRKTTAANDNRSGGSAELGRIKNANSSTSNANKGTGWTDKKAGAQAIGLGYTLFMRDENGRNVRVEPSR